MSSQNKQPQGLPNPYSVGGGLPNPYALDTAPGPAQAEQPEEKKLHENPFHNPHSIKRPQAKSAPTVKKPTAPKASATKTTAPKPMTASSSSDGPRGLEFWRSTEEDDAAILEAKRESNRRQKRERKEAKNFRKLFGMYAASKPHMHSYASNIKAFRATPAVPRSEEGWEARWGKDTDGLPKKNHLKRGAPSSDDGSNDPSSRPMSQSSSDGPVAPANPMFAPPSFDEPSAPSSGPAPVIQASANTELPSPPASDPIPVAQTAEEAFQYRVRLTEQRGAATSMPTAPAPAPVIQAGEDAFQRGLRMAQQLAATIKSAGPPPPPPPPPSPPPPPPSLPPPPPPPTSKKSMTISAPPVHYGVALSAPPVHYARPDSESKVGNSANERPSKRQKTNEPKPKKLSYGAKLMSKMGYVEGQGLGRNNDGVTTHLEVKARKDPGGRQIRDEFDDNKNAKTQQVFDITGGLRARKDDYGPFGEPSRVIVTWGCVDGVDFADDADRDDGGIRQEMGEVFNTKFGNINRIYIGAVGSGSTAVYVQFNDALSALNAVNRFHEGYTFRGRKIKAQFYNEPKFDASIFDH